LQVHLKITADDLAEAEKEKQKAVGDCRRLQKHYKDAQKMCTADQLLCHYEQVGVSKLKQRLHDVVASAEHRLKADAAYIDLLIEEATPSNSTECQRNPRLLRAHHRLCIEEGHPLAIKSEDTM
jgi:hypothetical protein